MVMMTISLSGHLLRTHIKNSYSLCHEVLPVTWEAGRITLHFQQYVNRELPDVQADFRKGRGTRDQIANICWVTEEAREFEKKHLFLLY